MFSSSFSTAEAVLRKWCWELQGEAMDKSGCFKLQYGIFH